MQQGLDEHAINNARQVINGYLVKTPVLPLAMSKVEPYLPQGARFFCKLELYQCTGSFKARGAYLGVAGLDGAEAKRGVVTASGGNHALAVAWAARARQVPVKVVMTESADPARVEGCRALGAEIVSMKDIAMCFECAARIAREEGRRFLHPFNDPNMVLGSATCGAELVEQSPRLDAVVLPVGGGGLIAGMASAIKELSPTTTVYGVEPEGCANFSRSLEAGKPIRIEGIKTIADSLGSPETLPYSFDIARSRVDEVVTVSDDALASMMLRMRDSLSLMVEPACAASLTGALGPLRKRLEGKSVGVLACGSTISPERWHNNTRGNTAFCV